MQFFRNFIDNFQHKKPLLWSTLKSTQRFAFVGNSKVEHIVLNPEEEKTVDSTSDAFHSKGGREFYPEDLMDLEEQVS